MRVDELCERQRVAIRRRAALLDDPQTTVARLVDGAGDGLAGLVVERLGPVLIVQVHEGVCRIDESTIAAALGPMMNAVGAASVYRKIFPRDRTSPDARIDAANRDAAPWLGAEAPPEIEVLEHGLRYVVHPYDGFATGLFLDHREQRRWLRAQARGARVLNLFAYTCAFGAAAGAGAAASTTHVDISKRFLEWGKRNIERNQLAAESQRFLCRDAVAFCRKAAEKGERFDLVIVDPPTFARLERGRTFELRRDAPALLADAMRCTSPGGRLLLCGNQQGVGARQRQAWARHAAAEAGVEVRASDGPAEALDFRASGGAQDGLCVRVG